MGEGAFLKLYHTVFVFWDYIRKIPGQAEACVALKAEGYEALIVRRLSVTDLTSRPEDAGSEDMALINASFAPLSLYLSGACHLLPSISKTESRSTSSVRGIGQNSKSFL